MQLVRGKWRLFTRGSHFIVEREGKEIEDFKTRQQYDDWVSFLTQFQAGRTGELHMPLEDKGEVEKPQSIDRGLDLSKLFGG